MTDIYGGAQPTLLRAREQAMKNNYPYFTLITSTPNGTNGDGEWFHDRWIKAVDSDDLFTLNTNTGLEIWREDVNLDDIVTNPSKNTFVKVKYHWTEDPSKDDKWYQEQCQELSDQRKINQELDLLFVGGSNCIFSDKTLASFKSSTKNYQIHAPHGSILNVFDQLDPKDYYIIGCDTAESLEGAFCAIQVFSFRRFKQVAELQSKFGSYYNFAEVIHFVFQWLYKSVQNRIILSIENNTINISGFIQQCMSNNFVNCWKPLRANRTTT